MKPGLLGAVVAGVLPSAIMTPAPAADASDHMRVKVGDLNLQSGSGAQEALNRIAVASRQFCGLAPGDRNLQVQEEARKCDSRMTYLAVRKLDSPMVTAAYESSHARPPIELARR